MPSPEVVDHSQMGADLELRSIPNAETGHGSIGSYGAMKLKNAMFWLLMRAI